MSIEDTAMLQAAEIDTLKDRIAALEAERDALSAHVEALRNALYPGGCSRDPRCYRCWQCEAEDRKLCDSTPATSLAEHDRTLLRRAADTVRSEWEAHVPPLISKSSKVVAGQRRRMCQLAAAAVERLAPPEKPDV